MPVSATTTGAAWQDGGTTAAKAFIVSKRCVSTTVLSPYSAMDMASLRSAAGATPLSVLNTFNTTDVLGPLRLRSTQFTPVGQDGKIWDATLTYGTEYTWATPPGGTARYINPVEVAFQTSERTAAQFRHGGTSPSANLNSTSDIAGTKRDQEGVPIQARIPVSEFTVSIGVDTTQRTLTVVRDNIATLQGAWNSLAFLHWTASKVYCVSGNLTPIRDEWYRVTYVFRTDLWFDCEQVPDRDNDNYVRLDSSGKAATVYWRSFERGTADFNAIFNDTTDSTLAKQMALEGSWLTYP